MKQALSEDDAVAKLQALRNPPKEETNESEEIQEEQGQEQEALLDESAVEETADSGEPTETESELNSDEESSDAESIELDDTQLSQLLGLESDHLIVDEKGKVKIRTKVDGEIGEATLQDLIKSYQTSQYLDKKARETQSMVDKRKQELADFVNKTQSFASQSAQILETLKSAYVQDLTEQQWAELKEYDKAEYAAKKEEVRERQARFQGLAGQALRHIEEAQKEQQAEVQKQYNEYLETQRQILVKAIPNIATEAKNIASYAHELGFSENEINQIADARIFQVLHKAMLFDKGKQGATKKLAKPIPKVVKPSARKDKSAIALEALAKQKAKLKKSGNPEDLINMLKSSRK